MRCTSAFALVVTAVLAPIATPLAAQTATFSGHGVASQSFGVIEPGTFSFSYVLPIKPTPDFTFGSGFGINDLTGTITQNGHDRAITGEVDFYNTAGECGGFSLSANQDDGATDVADVCGPTLFKGPTDHPTFVFGSYTGFTPKYDDPATVITDASITPEPSAIALLGTGLVGLIPVARRRRAAA